MILLFALAQAQSLPVTPPPEEDVIVIGRRLKAWRGKIRSDPFGTRCVTQRSTGDREIDAVGCTAMERCWPDMLPRFKAARAKGVAKNDRKRLEAEATVVFSGCVKPQRASLIEALRARRAAARGSGA